MYGRIEPGEISMADRASTVVDQLIENTRLPVDTLSFAADLPSPRIEVDDPGNTATRNLASALRRVRRIDRHHNVGALVLLSDGFLANDQMAARRGAGPPIRLAVRLGPHDQSSMAELDDLNVPPRGRRGRTSTVNAGLSIRSNQSQRFQVVLSDDDGVVVRQTIVCSPGRSTRRVSMRYRPRQAGRRLLSLRVVEEATGSESDIATATMYVESGKTTILMLAGQPGPDFAFIRRTIGDLEGVLVRESISSLGGNSDSRLTGQVDAIVGVDWPGVTTEPEEIRDIGNLVASRGIPAAMFFGQKINKSRLGPLATILPDQLTDETDQSVPVRFYPTAAGQRDRLFAGVSSAEWAALPALETHAGSLRTTGSSLILAEGMSDNGASRSIVVRSSTAGNSASVTIFRLKGLWRWGLSAGGRSESSGNTAPSSHRKLIANLVRTLEEERSVWMLRSDRREYERGTPVTLELHRSGAKYRHVPASDSGSWSSSLSVSIGSNGKRRAVNLEVVGPRRMETTLTDLEPGTYRYELEGVASGPEIVGTFEVSTETSERQTGMIDSLWLRRFVGGDGSQLVDYDSIDGLRERLHKISAQESRAREQTEVTSARRSIPLLIAILCALCLAWFGRHRLRQSNAESMDRRVR